MITPGDIDDRKPLEYKTFIDYICGNFFGGKGYISKNLFQRLFVDGIQLITKLKSNMKEAVMSVSDRLLLRKRAIIETVNDELKNIAQVEHSRHRCFDNFIVNLLGAIVAYCLFPKKPCINVQRTIDTQLILFSIQRTHVILGYLGGAEPTNALIVLSCYDLYDVSYAMLIEKERFDALWDVDVRRNWQPVYHE